MRACSRRGDLLRLMLARSMGAMAGRLLRDLGSDCLLIMVGLASGRSGDTGGGVAGGGTTKLLIRAFLGALKALGEHSDGRSDGRSGGGGDGVRSTSGALFRWRGGGGDGVVSGLPSRPRSVSFRAGNRSGNNRYGSS